jgi:hypothetical protein
MRTPYSTDVVNQVIAMLLAGDTFSIIHDKFGISSGTISEIKKQISSKLGEGDVEYTIETAKNLRKSGHTFSDALMGIRIISMIKNCDIDPEELNEFITEIFENSKKYNCTIEDQLEYSSQLFSIQQETNIPINKISSECQNALAKKECLDKEIIASTKVLQESQKTTQRILDENNQTVEKLDAFTKCKNILDDAGVSLDDYSKFATMIQKAKDNGYDETKIITYLEKEQDHEQRLTNLRHKSTELVSNNDNLSAKNETLAVTIDVQASLVSQLDNLEELGITDEHLDVLCSAIADVAASHNIESAKAFDVLCNDIQDNYDKIVGLKSYVAKLDAESQLKSRDIEVLSTKIENLEIKHKQDLQAIAILKKYKQHGIDSQVIITWDKSLESSGLDVDSFGKNLNQFVAFEKLIASQDAVLVDLRQQITKATSDLNLRNKKKQEIESHINYIEKIAKGKFDNFITSALEKLSDANAVMVKSVNDVGDCAKNNIAEINTTAVGKLNSTVTDLNESISKGLIVSEKISKIESFAPIWALVEESKYEAYRANPILILILEKLREKHKDELFFRNNIERLIKALREDLS